MLRPGPHSCGRAHVGHRKGWGTQRSMKAVPSSRAEPPNAERSAGADMGTKRLILLVCERDRADSYQTQMVEGR